MEMFSRPAQYLHLQPSAAGPLLETNKFTLSLQTHAAQLLHRQQHVQLVPPGIVVHKKVGPRDYSHSGQAVMWAPSKPLQLFPCTKSRPLGPKQPSVSGPDLALMYASRNSAHTVRICPGRLFTLLPIAQAKCSQQQSLPLAVCQERKCRDPSHCCGELHSGNTVTRASHTAGATMSPDLQHLFANLLFLNL